MIVLAFWLYFLYVYPRTNEDFSRCPVSSNLLRNTHNSPHMHLRLVLPVNGPCPSRLFLNIPLRTGVIFLDKA